jgi:hypothetical protein
MVFGFGPVRPSSPRSSALIVATSSSESWKSKIAKFSRMRSACVDFGKTMSPRWMCQRRATCAGVRPTRPAISLMVGSSFTLPLAIGAQASVAMPWRASAPRAASLPKKGWTSIWLTAGTTPVASMIVCRWSGSKLETPTERARPSSWSSVRVRQVVA